MRNISYVATGTLIAASLSFIFNILGGRILGPAGYGKFVFIQSMAMFLYMPMLMGISTAMVKYNAEREDYNRQKIIISTSYMLVSVSILIFACMYILFSNYISSLFSSTKEEYFLAIVFAFLFTIYSLTTDTLRSMHDMKKLSMLRPIFSLTVVLSLMVLVSFDYISYKSMIVSIFVAYLIISIYVIYKYKKYITFDFDIIWAKTLAKYSNFAVIGGVSYIFYTNIDKILINKYLLVADLGLYNSYYFSSINLAAMGVGIFQTVFFPTISKCTNKKAILKKLNIFIVCVSIIGIPFLLTSEFIILNLYGKNYEINLALMLLFAFTSILFILFDTYAWYFNSLGTKGVKLNILGVLTIAASNILLNIILIPRYGLHGAIGSTALAYCIGIPVIFYRWKYIKHTVYESNIT
jgi:O-antigen/teichoic acid export membrane protein